MNCKDCCYNLPKDGHSYCTYEDGECVKISVLEKENAELNNFIMQSKKDGISPINALIIKNLANQLTKAKVALQNVIDYLGQFCSDYPDCVIEAEQFLKDSEVEK